jgi:peptidoglycan hydrolase CwlO-like protein
MAKTEGFKLNAERERNIRKEVEVKLDQARTENLKLKENIDELYPQIDYVYQEKDGLERQMMAMRIELKQVKSDLEKAEAQLMHLTYEKTKIDGLTASQ